MARDAVIIPGSRRETTLNRAGDASVAKDVAAGIGSA
jgi:hypothetical protein